jgi:hypothetical protein
MLILVMAIALATQVPLAITLEVDLHANTAGLGPSIYSVGLPEELAKAIPVLAVALIYRLFRQRSLTPVDYLFLGAVSGLAQFYLTVQAAIPSIQQLILSGHSAPDSLFAVLIGPVRYFTLEFVWRFVTDPISHACWSGLTGYFIGLRPLGGTSGRRWGGSAGSMATGCGSWSPRSAESCSSATRRSAPAATGRPRFFRLGRPSRLPRLSRREPAGPGPGGNTERSVSSSVPESRKLRTASRPRVPRRRPGERGPEIRKPPGLGCPARGRVSGWSSVDQDLSLCPERRSRPLAQICILTS